MSTRERLAAKRRRRVVVSVEVAPMGDDQAARVVAARTALLTLIVGKGEGEQTQDEARAALEAAESENKAAVAFTALDPADFEKVIAAFPSPDGADGGMDQARALPVLAALCADDEELQDDEWWAEQLTSGAWGYGERLDLWQQLLALNTARPAVHVPKD